MIRLVLLFAVICLLTLGAVWLADAPGVVVIDWQGYRVELSLVMLASIFVVFAALVALFYRLWLWLKAGPGRIGGVFAEKRRLKGLNALTNGMVALASGDAEEARRRAVEAEKLLADEPMTILLAAQAAELNDDDRAAGIYYHKLVDRSDTEFIGLKGLIARARRDGDIPAALSHAKRAAKLRPGAEWVGRELFELHILMKDWAGALGVLEQQPKQEAAKSGALRHKKAVLKYELGRQKQLTGAHSEALSLWQAAHELDEGFVPATALAAAELAAAGKQRKAQKLIAQTWQYEPHPDLAAAFENLHVDESGAALLARAKKTLEPLHVDHVQTLLLMARAAMKASEWGQARSYLNRALESRPTKRVYQLLAALEEKANADMVASREWIVKSVDAADDSCWVCSSCGRQEAQWMIQCPSCDSFDSLQWRDQGRGQSDQPLLLNVEANEADLAAESEGGATGFEPTPETLREIQRRDL